MIVAEAAKELAPKIQRTPGAAPMGTPKMPAPPMGQHGLDEDRWKPLFAGPWMMKEHNNILEPRGILAVLKHRSRTSGARSRRALIFTNSMVSLGAFSKGRSSATTRFRICRQAAVIQVVCRIKPATEEHL